MASIHRKRCIGGFVVLRAQIRVLCARETARLGVTMLNRLKARTRESLLASETFEALSLLWRHDGTAGLI